MYHRHPTLHALTFDLEEYFQVSAFEGLLSSENKEQLPRRAAYITHKILDLLCERQMSATFFTLSSVALYEKTLIQRIVTEGHELASHGVQHDRVRDLTEKAFYDDITQAKKTLEDISGITVNGYRAPSFSIGADTPFAYDMLIKAGYHYSSSIHPIQHDHYGDVNAPLDIHKPRPDHNFYEFPITILQKWGRHIPVGGGGWFRMMPFFIYKNLLRQASKAKRPLMFYTHPWEYDPDQPKIQNLPFKTSFRHYVNLSRNFSKLEKLLGLYQWSRCDDVLNLYASKV